MKSFLLIPIERYAPRSEASPYEAYGSYGVPWKCDDSTYFMSSTVILRSGILHHGIVSDIGLYSASGPSQIDVVGLKYRSMNQARGVLYTWSASSWLPNASRAFNLLPVPGLAPSSERSRWFLLTSLPRSAEHLFSFCSPSASSK